MLSATREAGLVQIANSLTDRIDVESRPLIWQVDENGLWFLLPECSDVDPSHQRNGDFTAMWLRFSLISTNLILSVRTDT
jgi:hypothetical protein